MRELAAAHESECMCVYLIPANEAHFHAATFLGFGVDDLLSEERDLGIIGWKVVSSEADSSFEVRQVIGVASIEGSGALAAHAKEVAASKGTTHDQFEHIRVWARLPIRDRQSNGCRHVLGLEQQQRRC